MDITGDRAHCKVDLDTVPSDVTLIYNDVVAGDYFSLVEDYFKLFTLF
jgi:hypothetical protein